MPWIDATMNIEHICCIWMQGTIEIVCFIDGTKQKISIEISSINISTLLNEKHQWKPVTKQFFLFIGSLIESEFIACLISPLKGYENEQQI